MGGVVEGLGGADAVKEEVEPEGRGKRVKGGELGWERGEVVVYGLREENRGHCSQRDTQDEGRKREVFETDLISS